MHQNGSFGRESIDAFSLATKTLNFENALVWTGPYCDTPREHNDSLFYLTTLNKSLRTSPEANFR